MASITRILAIGALLFAAGCPSNPGAILCPTGILCPADMQCGAVEAVCLTNGCGNGFRDGGEECDDGNITEGDGCSTICRTEACGNNVLDPSEMCDDGNATGGDGCSADCRSKEMCGNAVTDLGEVCDDGNLANGDGCTGTPQTVDDGMGGSMTSPEPCMSREVCGNGIRDFQVGEVCDDGNTISGDGCNSDCRSGEGCGNGFVDPGEQCDDGDSDNNDRCRNDCKTAMCGDGIVESTGNREQCDAGNTTAPAPVETAACNIDCTTRTCGDGKVNQTAGEQCDNGVGQNVDINNCTSVCMLNICGDGKIDMQDPVKEGCDDANSDNFDGCSNACVSATCGNMTVDVGEQCDDGDDQINDPTANDDACVGNCQNAVCGDGFTRIGVEDCDDNNKLNGDGCSSTCRFEGCRNGILDPGEECDDGNVLNTDACVGMCKIAVCGDTFKRTGVEDCDDGNTMNGDMCSSSCRFEGCGNGTLDPGEQCDDGQMPPVGGDGCSASCQLEDCGDGFVDVGEQCDGNGIGGGGETSTCNIDCTMRTCGDSKINATAGEQCDAGTIMGVNQNANNRDCLAVTCRLNVCTDGHVNTGGPSRIEACDDGNQNNSDGCNNSCQLASCGNGLIDPLEECDLGMGVNSNTGACTLGCKLATCGDNLIRTGVEECDGANVTVGASTYTCSPAGGSLPGCRFQRCGNNVMDPGEQCDDEFVAPGIVLSAGSHNQDGCTFECKIEFCGDGIVTTSGPGVEQCDPGTTLAQTSTCNRDCSGPPSCGDGIVNSAFHPSSAPVGQFEECDPPAPGSGCSSACQFESCGDGILQSPEECDGSIYAVPPPGGATCVNCLAAYCGNGMLDGSEQCDNGAANSNTGACTLSCTIATCGDGFTQAGLEQCDLGSTPTNNNGPTASCTATCQNNVCGDGFVRATVEACDDGNRVNTDSCTNTCVASTCGDGIVNVPPAAPFNGTTMEACDEGPNNGLICPYGVNCNRCNATCEGLITPDSPNEPRCGDNAVQAPFEQCDGTATITTMCASLGFGFTGGTPTCMVGACFFDFSTCTICGDGVREGAEGCDDGNTVSGDGCSSSCAVQSGYSCTTGMPNVCTMAQTITFTSAAPGGANVGGATYSPTATATSGLTVTITVDASAAPICSISGGMVSFDAPGTCVLNANQAGNGTYSAAPQVQQSFAVAAM